MCVQLAHELVNLCRAEDSGDDGESRLSVAEIHSSSLYNLDRQLQLG
jgi:hypothetical protein